MLPCAKTQKQKEVVQKKERKEKRKKERNVDNKEIIE